MGCHRRREEVPNTLPGTVLRTFRVETARFQTAPTQIRLEPVKRGKKSRKRKRGPASLARIRAKELFAQKRKREQQRLKELKEETRECYESVLERYPLSEDERESLEHEWKIGLEVIAEYEDATTPDDYYDLLIHTYESEPLSDIVVESGISEVAWRSGFDLANALGLAMITIDEDGNINGEIIEY